MSEYSGRKIAFGLAKEAVRGTAESNPDYTLNHLSIGFYPRADKKINESVVGSLVKGNDSTTMTKWAEGDFEMKIGVDSVGAILHAIFGSVVTTDNADADASVKDHTFDFDESNSPASYTFFRKDPNINEAYALGMVSEVEINAELGEWVKIKGTALTKAGVASSATYSRIEEVEFKPKHISAALAANLAGLDAASTVATLQSLKLNIKRTTEADYALETDEPYDISVREIEVTGELVTRWSDQAQKDAFLADTQQALRINMVNDDVTIGTAAHPGLKFDMGKVTFNDWSPDQGVSDKVNQTVGFTALLDVTTAKVLTAVLTNDVASY